MHAVIAFILSTLTEADFDNETEQMDQTETDSYPNESIENQNVLNEYENQETTEESTEPVQDIPPSLEETSEPIGECAESIQETSHSPLHPVEQDEVVELSDEGKFNRKRFICCM